MSLRVASRVPSPAFECLVIAETMFDDVDHADLVSLAKRYGIERPGDRTARSDQLKTGSAGGHKRCRRGLQKMRLTWRAWPSTGSVTKPPRPCQKSGRTRVVSDISICRDERRHRHELPPGCMTSASEPELPESEPELPPECTTSETDCGLQCTPSRQPASRLGRTALEDGLRCASPIHHIHTYMHNVL